MEMLFCFWEVKWAETESEDLYFPNKLGLLFSNTFFRTSFVHLFGLQFKTRTNSESKEMGFRLKIDKGFQSLREFRTIPNVSD